MTYFGRNKKNVRTEQKGREITRFMMVFEIDEPFFIRAMCFFNFLSSFLSSFVVFLHVILSYLTASIFRDSMLNCFLTGCCSLYSVVTPFGSVNNAILGPVCVSLASFLFLTVFNFSVNKKLAYESFRSF